MLSEREFIQLALPEKIQVILESGRELFCRKVKGVLVKLFTMNDFYVEIWYASKTNTIEKVELLQLEDVLANYDNQLDIKELLSK